MAASSSPVENAYPNFANGDVDLALSPIRRLKLHSDVLRGASGRFKELLTNENAAVLSKKVRDRGGVVRYRIELVGLDGLTDIGSLVAQKLNTKGSIVYDGGPRASMILERFGRDPANHILEDWESVIGALYGQRVKVGGSDDLTQVITRTENIANIVEYLKVQTETIFTPIELALVETQQILWQAIKNNPLSWLKLSFRIKSVAVFTEAAIHVVGLWHTFPTAEKEELDPKVHELFVRKTKQFHADKKAVEVQILEYKPEAIRYNKTTDRVKGKREHDPFIFLWIAFSGFQMWLAQAFAEGKGVSGPDGGFELFKLLYTGDESYYTRKEQSNYAGCSGPGRAVVSENIKLIKNDMRSLVKGFMVSKLRLNVRRTPVDHFACFDIQRKDCPWTAEAAVPDLPDDEEPDLDSEEENDDSEDDDDPEMEKTNLGAVHEERWEEGKESTDSGQVDSTKEAPIKRSHGKFAEDIDEEFVF